MDVPTQHLQDNSGWRFHHGCPWNCPPWPQGLPALGGAAEGKAPLQQPCRCSKQLQDPSLPSKACKVKLQPQPSPISPRLISKGWILHTMDCLQCLFPPCSREFGLSLGEGRAQPRTPTLSAGICHQLQRNSSFSWRLSLSHRSGSSLWVFQSVCFGNSRPFAPGVLSKGQIYNSSLLVPPPGFPFPLSEALPVTCGVQRCL